MAPPDPKKPVLDGRSQQAFDPGADEVESADYNGLPQGSGSPKQVSDQISLTPPSAPLAPSAPLVTPAQLAAQSGQPIEDLVAIINSGVGKIPANFLPESMAVYVNRQEAIKTEFNKKENLNKAQVVQASRKAIIRYDQSVVNAARHFQEAVKLLIYELKAKEKELSPDNRAALEELESASKELEAVIANQERALKNQEAAQARLATPEELAKAGIAVTPVVAPILVVPETAAQVKQADAVYDKRKEAIREELTALKEGGLLKQEAPAGQDYGLRGSVQERAAVLADLLQKKREPASVLTAQNEVDLEQGLKKQLQELSKALEQNPLDRKVLENYIYTLAEHPFGSRPAISKIMRDLDAMTQAMKSGAPATDVIGSLQGDIAKYTSQSAAANAAQAEIPIGIVAQRKAAFEAERKGVAPPPPPPPAPPPPPPPFPSAKVAVKKPEEKNTEEAAPVPAKAESAAEEQSSRQPSSPAVALAVGVLPGPAQLVVQQMDTANTFLNQSKELFKGVEERLQGFNATLQGLPNNAAMQEKIKPMVASLGELKNYIKEWVLKFLRPILNFINKQLDKFGFGGNLNELMQNLKKSLSGGSTLSSLQNLVGSLRQLLEATENRLGQFREALQTLAKNPAVQQALQDMAKGLEKVLKFIEKWMPTFLLKRIKDFIDKQLAKFGTSVDGLKADLAAAASPTVAGPSTIATISFDEGGEASAKAADKPGAKEGEDFVRRMLETVYEKEKDSPEVKKVSDKVWSIIDRGNEIKIDGQKNVVSFSKELDLEGAVRIATALKAAGRSVDFNSANMTPEMRKLMTQAAHVVDLPDKPSLQAVGGLSKEEIAAFEKIHRPAAAAVVTPVFVKLRELKASHQAARDLSPEERIAAEGLRQEEQEKQKRQNIEANAGGGAAPIVAPVVNPVITPASAAAALPGKSSAAAEAVHPGAPPGQTSAEKATTEGPKSELKPKEIEAVKKDEKDKPSVVAPEPSLQHQGEGLQDTQKLDDKRIEAREDRFKRETAKSVVGENSFSSRDLVAQQEQDVARARAHRGQEEASERSQDAAAALKAAEEKNNRSDLRNRCRRFSSDSGGGSSVDMAAEKKKEEERAAAAAVKTKPPEPRSPGIGMGAAG